MKKIYLCTLAVLALCLGSCTSSKTSLTYFEDLKSLEDGVINTGIYQLKIVPDDELFISVTSTVPEATLQYNLPLKNPATRSNLEMNIQPSQQTYIVDLQGNIDFPVLGKVHVEGLTTRQLQAQLVERISRDVDDPIVKVELVNFKVNVLGEVKNPGTRKVERERYTLLDALAAAGDLTEYGERENVLLIRDEGDKLTYHHFNLNSSSTMSSPYFYLKQNDVIVVEPNTIRKDNSKYNQFNAYKISVISTVVSACSVVASLIIALAVK